MLPANGVNTITCR